MESQTSSWSLTRAALHETLSTLKPLARAAWIPLLIVHLTEFVASQYLSFASSVLTLSRREDFLLVALTSALMLLFYLLWMPAWNLVLVRSAIRLLDQAAPTSLRETSLKETFIRFFQPLVIEHLRSFAAVLLRLPLLIVPALIEYVRLSFVLHVVLLDPHYSKGEVDALNASRKLSKGHWILLSISHLAPFLILLASQAVTQSNSSDLIWKNPLGVVIHSAVTLVTNVIVGLFLLSLYRRITYIKAKDADVYMERDQEPRSRTDI